jgi:hypothetical protein
MALKDNALQHVSSLSGALALAIEEDDVEVLAALVVAARVIEQEASERLATRVTEEALDGAKVSAYQELGW